MATHTGNGGQVLITAAQVAHVLSWELTTDATIIEDNAQGDASKTHKVGTKGWSGSVSCYFDETDSTGQEVMLEGLSVALHLLPDGATTGDIDFNGTATIASVAYGSANDSIVTANFTFTGNGDLTRSVLA